MPTPLQFSTQDTDQLKELLNIGVSHAGTTLSDMVGRRVTISVPSMQLKNAQSASDFVIENPDDVTLAILLRLSGGIEGYVLLFFPHTAATHLLHALSGKTVGDIRALTEFDRSAFQEIGNVITGGMLKGLSQFLHVPLLHSVPDVVIDMGGAMFNSLFATMISHHDEFLSLDVSICVDASSGAITCDVDDQAMGRMFLLLGPATATRILDITHRINALQP